MEALGEAHQKQCGGEGTATGLEEIAAECGPTTVTARLPLHPTLLSRPEGKTYNRSVVY